MSWISHGPAVPLMLVGAILLGEHEHAEEGPRTQPSRMMGLQMIQAESTRSADTHSDGKWRIIT